MLLFAVLCAPLAAQSAPAACGTGVYTAGHGETLTDIAQKLGGTPDSARTLHALNYDMLGPDPGVLMPGLRLSVICPLIDIADNWWIIVGPSLIQPMVDMYGAQVLDIRPNVRSYDPVIPGSVVIPVENWYGPNGASGPLQSEAALNALIGLHGLRLDRPIVIVHNRNSAHSMGPAAYVYWILKSLGAKRMSIVASGFEGWVDEGRPTTTERTLRPSYTADFKLSRQWRAGAEEIRDIVYGQRAGVLLDGSYTPIYRTDRRGRAQIVETIPGAHHMSAPASFTVFAREQLQPKALLEMLEKAAGDWRSRTLVSFSSDGPMGALNWFYVSEVVGIEDVLFFPEALYGWTEAGQRTGYGAKTDR